MQRGSEQLCLRYLYDLQRDRSGSGEILGGAHGRGGHDGPRSWREGAIGCDDDAGRFELRERLLGR